MPAYKGTKVLGTLKGGFHPKGTAPVAGMTGTRGPRTTDPKMVGKRTMGRATGDDIDPRNNSYVRAMTSSKPPQPTAAERAASRKQDESLKKAKVTKQEGRTIESANRSEGSGKKPMKMAKGGKATKFGAAMKKKSADTMGRAMKMNKGGKCYAKGGSIDGIAKKGKTKGKMC